MDQSPNLKKFQIRKHLKKLASQKLEKWGLKIEIDSKQFDLHREEE